MSKTFSGNSFRFRTPSSTTTKFHFDDNQLELDTNTVKMNTIQCNSIKNQNGSNMFSFNGNTCDLHGISLINGNFYSEATEYITPLYYTGSGNIELTTDGNVFNGSNRYYTSKNTIGQMRFRILIKKADMSRIGIYSADFSFINNDDALSFSSLNITKNILIGNPFLISISSSNECIIVYIDTGIDVCLCKVFAEEFSM